MKVFIGIDGSQHALAAVEFVGQLLTPERDQIVFYYGVPEVHVQDDIVNKDNILARARQVIAESVFQEAVNKLPQSLADSVETIVGEGDARKEIVSVARSQQADLMVVGARGRGALERLLLGSVAERVVGSAEIPVLVVRGNTEAADLKALLAYDPSDSTQKAIDFLGNFSWPSEAQGFLFSAIESFYAGPLPDWLESQKRDPEIEEMSKAWVKEHEEEVQQTDEKLRAVARQLPAIFQQQNPIVCEGIPGEKILEIIEEKEMDLVILGAGGGTLSRIFIGSTASKVASYAPCSVLIVR